MALSINPDRIEEDEAYMRMAEVWALRSKANRKRVGALIVLNQQIISDGWNGMPTGSSDDVCEYQLEDGTLVSKDDVVHAEMNAITKLAKFRGGGNGATLYVTMSPCSRCASAIQQTGIKRVVWRETYRDHTGIAKLKEYGIECSSI